MDPEYPHIDDLRDDEHVIHARPSELREFRRKVVEGVFADPRFQEVNNKVRNMEVSMDTTQENINQGVGGKNEAAADVPAWKNVGQFRQWAFKVSHERRLAALGKNPTPSQTEFARMEALKDARAMAYEWELEQIELSRRLGLTTQQWVTVAVVLALGGTMAYRFAKRETIRDKRLSANADALNKLIDRAAERRGVQVPPGEVVIPTLST